MKTYREIIENIILSKRDLDIENIKPNVVFINTEDLKVLEDEINVIFPFPTAEEAYSRVVGLRIIEYSGKTIVARVNDKDVE